MNLTLTYQVISKLYLISQQMIWKVNMNPEQESESESDSDSFCTNSTKEEC